jgi:hypothetical protein
MAGISSGDVAGTLRITRPVAGFSTSMVSVAWGCSIVAMAPG